MNKLAIFLALIISASNFLTAMENPHKKQKKEQEIFLFAQLPKDLQLEIFGHLTKSETLDEAIKNIKAMAVTHPQFDSLINDSLVMDFILHKLSKNFKKDPIFIAALMQTKGSINWLVNKANKKDVENFLTESLPFNYHPNYHHNNAEFIEKLIDAHFELSDSVKRKILTSRSPHTRTEVSLINKLWKKLNLSPQLKSEILLNIAQNTYGSLIAKTTSYSKEVLARWGISIDENDVILNEMRLQALQKLIQNITQIEESMKKQLIVRIRSLELECEEHTEYCQRTGVLSILNLLKTLQ